MLKWTDFQRDQSRFPHVGLESFIETIFFAIYFLFIFQFIYFLVGISLFKASLTVNSQLIYELVPAPRWEEAAWMRGLGPAPPHVPTVWPDPLAPELQLRLLTAANRLQPGDVSNEG